MRPQTTTPVAQESDAVHVPVIADADGSVSETVMQREEKDGPDMVEEPANPVPATSSDAVNDDVAADPTIAASPVANAPDQHTPDIPAGTGTNYLTSNLPFPNQSPQDDATVTQYSLPPPPEVVPEQAPQDSHAPSQPGGPATLGLYHPFVPGVGFANHDTHPEELSNPDDYLEDEPLPHYMQKPTERGQIEAFAKLEFTDGNYYITTHSCELGRDVGALRAAEAREASSSSQHHHSSSGKHSHSGRMGPRDENGVHGSVVSERGGFCGLDDRERENENGKHSSMSGSEVIKPEDMHISSKPYDYAAGAITLEDDGEKVRPVDASALLPSPDQNPLIPVHPTTFKDGAEEIAAHKTISRRHVRIKWNFERMCFELIILGRNGAFLNGRWHAKGVALPLNHGAHIQIGLVEVKFKLPVQPAADSSSEGAADDSLLQEEESRLADGTEDDVKDSIENDELATPSKPGPKLKLSFKKKPPPETPEGETPIKESSANAVGSANPTNPEQPAKRRGPGRPPKDGIMSNRERREIEKAKKLAAAKEANGGVTPPPSGRAKLPKPKELADPDAPKPEKRKYTKRKRPEGTPGEGNGEGGSGDDEDDEKPSAKKVREEKSPSPEYPAESTFTEEQLAKPPYNYTVLIFEALQEAGKPLTLRNVYRKLKIKYPYFVHRCPTDGWQSSVRHNLNGTPTLFEHAARDGKGWSWKIKPGATIEREKKRKPEPVERPDQAPQSRYPPSGPRPPGQPYGYNYPTHYPPGAPPPPGMQYYPPGGPPGQYPPPQANSASFPTQQYMGPPPPRGSATPGSAGATPATTQPGALGMLRPGQAPPAPQPYRGPPNQQPPNRQQQASPHNRPGPPGHAYAPRNTELDPLLPCTPEGLVTIQNFQNAIFADTPNKAEQEKLTATFASVRARVLGGRKQSQLPGGETEQERVLLGHVQELVKRFPNKIYNAEMVRQREEERERRESEAKARLVAGAPGGVPVGVPAGGPDGGPAGAPKSGSSGPVNGAGQPNAPVNVVANGSSPSVSAPPVGAPKGPAQPNGTVQINGSSPSPAPPPASKPLNETA